VSESDGAMSASERSRASSTSPLEPSSPPASSLAPDVVDVSGLEAYVSFEQPRFGMDDVARVSGLDVQQLHAYWRALGFPEAMDGERLLTESDVEMLSTVVTFIADGSLDPEVALQMARVIGSALDRIAAAQVDALVSRLTSSTDTDTTAQRRRTVELAALMPRILEFVWRRQLAAAARRRMLRSATGGDTPVCVGFADLVGFTAQTQQLDQTELARVVNRFEAIAYDVVAGHGGRVVKTIGDEVMFLSDDVVTGSEIALDLARTYRDDPDLSDVRVGLATGPVLEREGDVFGHTVNLASRTVSIAYPGSVVVSEGVHDALVGDVRFELTSLRNHYLKDIGRVPLWRLRLAGDAFEQTYRAARDQTSVRHRLLQETWRQRHEDLRARAAGGLRGEAAGRLAELPERVAQVLSGQASPEVLQSLIEEPTADELEALTSVVLEAEIDADVQLDLLTGIVAAEALRELDLEADRKATEADEEAERRLRRIEEETARRVAEVEREAREKIAAAVARAAEESRAVDVEAARRVRTAVEEAHDKAEQATRDARARAARQAQRARRRSR
jgi:adenylate cyclase